MGVRAGGYRDPKQGRMPRKEKLPLFAGEENGKPCMHFFSEVVVGIAGKWDMVRIQMAT